jgi:alpha-glucosidase
LESKYRQDPTFFRTKGERVGRDGCRVPIPWQSDAPAFGFSATGKSWLPQPDSYQGYSRNLQLGIEGSTLELYKSLLKLRKSHDLGNGSLTWKNELVGENGLAYLNNGILVVANIGGDKIKLPIGKILVSSQVGLESEGTLETDQVAWIQI